MAPKKKQSATAPAVSVPVKRSTKSKKAVPVAEVKSPRRPGSKKAGLPTKAERSVANKAAYHSARAIVVKLEHEVQATVAAERKIGRPPGPEFPWTAELGESLFVLLATGSSMRDISNIEGNPSLYQLLKWVYDKDHPFSKIRERAKEMLVPLFEDDARALTQVPTSYSIVTHKQVLTRDGDVEDLVEQRTVDNVERAKLAFQGLQWTLAHLMPKKHGRSPDTGAQGPNEQLEGLFAALKQGPAK
jgi:hypothetical protein